MPNAPPRHPGLAKVQHYVPKCLLRGFTAGKSDKVWVYDKQSDRKPFVTAVKNVAAEQGFYNLDTPQGTATLEPFLGRVEDRVAAILRIIRREESLATLTELDTMGLAVFAAIQMQRTASFRLNIADMEEQLSARMRDIGTGYGIPDHHLDANMPGARKMTDAELKALTLSMTADAARLGPLVYEKSLILCKAPAGDPFLLSDNPVALHNMQDHGLRGNLGLAVEGIEIYLPISSQLLLWWVCPSYEKLFRENLSSAETVLPYAPMDQRGKLERLLSGNKQFLTALDAGNPLLFSTDNMLHANSLQVHYAARFVFAPTADFALVREMIEKYPDLRHGPRGTVQ